MTKKLNKTIKEHGAVTLDEMMDKNFGKKGTKKRAKAELKIKKTREKLEEKLYSNQDMIDMYNDAQELALKKGKYTAISGFKKIISKFKIKK
jgi:predicted ribosome quality control (RQC) complex YloA/Tae2 family protein